MKKIITSVIVVTILGIGGGIAFLNRPQSSGATQGIPQTHSVASTPQATVTSGTPSQDTPTPGVTHTYTSLVSPTAPAPTPSAPVQPPSAPADPTNITVIKSSLQLDLVNGGGYCTLVYSDGTTDHAPATLTTTNNGNNSATTDNCQDFVGQTK